MVFKVGTDSYDSPQEARRFIGISDATFRQRKKRAAIHLTDAELDQLPDKDLIELFAPPRVTRNSHLARPFQPFMLDTTWVNSLEDALKAAGIGQSTYYARLRALGLTPDTDVSALPAERRKPLFEPPKTTPKGETIIVNGQTYTSAREACRQLLSKPGATPEQLDSRWSLVIQRLNSRHSGKSLKDLSEQELSDLFTPPESTEITVDFIPYASIAHAAERLNVPYEAVRSRINRLGGIENMSQQQINAAFDFSSEASNKPKALIVRDTEYPSMRAAALDLGLSPNSIKGKLRRMNRKLDDLAQEEIDQLFS